MTEPPRERNTVDVFCTLSVLFLLNSFDLSVVSFIYLFIFHLLFRVLLFFLPASRVTPSDAALVILSRKLE